MDSLNEWKRNLSEFGYKGADCLLSLDFYSIKYIFTSQPLVTMGASKSLVITGLINIRDIPKEDLLDALWHRSMAATCCAMLYRFDRPLAFCEAEKLGWNLHYV